MSILHLVKCGATWRISNFEEALRLFGWKASRCWEILREKCSRVRAVESAVQTR